MRAWFCWCGRLAASLADMPLRDDGRCVHCFGVPKLVSQVRTKTLPSGTVIWYADNAAPEGK